MSSKGEASRVRASPFVLGFSMIACVLGLYIVVAAYFGFRFGDVKKGVSGYRLSSVPLTRDEECHGGLVVRRYVNHIGYKITYHLETENGRSISCVLEQPSATTKPD